MISPPAASGQAQVLEAYTELCALRAGWQGALILNIGLDARGAAMSLASNVAGAVCLSVEPDGEVLRAAFRRGACDFVVNTLDEALRAMKNEIRKGLPLSVGLAAEPEDALREMVERGVAPQLLSGLDADAEAVAKLESWGALRLRRGGTGDSQSARFVQERVIAERGWELRSFGLASAAAVREFDERAMGMLAPGDEMRRRWIGAAARLFARERVRVLWVTADEAAALGSAAAPVRVGG